MVPRPAGSTTGAFVCACASFESDAARTVEIQAALGAGQVPVLAPYRWLLAADPLPHRWEVTSDSIAAFVAGALDAELLVLLKPVAGPVDALVDECFREVVPRGLDVVALGSAELERLEGIVADRRSPPAV